MTEPIREVKSGWATLEGELAARVPLAGTLLDQLGIAWGCRVDENGTPHVYRQDRKPIRQSVIRATRNE
jgi:hypothetical protein